MAKSKDRKEAAEDASTKRAPKKRGTWFVFPLICILLAIVVLKGVERYQVEAKTKAYIRECQSFIETRKFTRAQESLALAQGLAENDPRIEDLEEALRDAQETDRLEKEVAVTLERGQWDDAENALVRLRAREPDHPFVESKFAELKRGRLREAVAQQERKLTAARQAEDLKEIAIQSSKLLTLDPDHPDAARWRELKKEAEETLRTKDTKAEKLYKRAFLLNTGSYNAEVLALAKQATELSNNEEYARFYQKLRAFPRTIHYPREFPTIQAAISAARQIDQIHIAAGAYHESVVIDKEVVIKGPEKGFAIIRCAASEGSALYITKKGEATLNNLQFQHTSREENAEAHSAVVVEGKGVFQSCVFYESAGHGIYVGPQGEVELTACRSEGNAWDGFALQGAGVKARLRSCIAVQNGHHGFDVWEGASAVIRLSNAERNKRAGVVCLAGASLELVDSRVEANDEAGLYIAGAAKVTVRKSDILRNGLGGVFADLPGEPLRLMATRVSGNQVGGVILTPGTRFEKDSSNTIEANFGTQVWREAVFAKAATKQESTDPLPPDPTPPPLESLPQLDAGEPIPRAIIVPEE